MSDKKKVESIGDVEFPTMDELGFEESEEDGGSIEAQERVPIAKQEKTKDEDKEADPKEEKTPPVEESEPVYTEKELQAADSGWVPKDQFTGDPTKWRPADIFLEQGALMSKVSASNKKVTKMQQALESAVTLIKKQAEAATVKTKNELIERRNAAIVDSDVDSVNQYDKQIQELETPPPSPQDVASDDVQQFVYDNAEWFNNDTNENAGMRAFAVRAEGQLHKNFPQMSEQQRLAKTKEMVTKAFPTRFGGGKPQPVVRKASQQKVEGASQRREVKSKGITYQDLPSHVKQVVHTVWIGSGKKISKDEYAKELLRTGAIAYE